MQRLAMAGLLTCYPNGGKRLPGLAEPVASVCPADSLQLRDSSGFAPLSLFNHDGNEPIAYAKIRQRGEIGK